jgi:hypothetical protein
MNETTSSRAYRDTRLGSTGGGADEIKLSIICQQMGVLPGRRDKGSRGTACSMPRHHYIAVKPEHPSPPRQEAGVGHKSPRASTHPAVMKK